MARSTLDSLIARVRRLIADPAGATAHHDDAAIAEALDARRRDVRTCPLRGEPTFAAGQSIAYRDYYAAERDWEDGATLQSGAYATLTPSASEPLLGHWAFAEHTPPPVFVTGAVHDPYGAAADLLRAWAAAEKLSFDFTSSQQQQFMRSQKITQILQLASEYDRRAQPIMVRLTRDDETPTGAAYGRLDERGLPYGTGYTRA